MTNPPSTPLGAFSISLAVKDIAASRAFYEQLGFGVIGGNQDEQWLILRNGGTTIGLFQGMFERNSLTFNPGWDAEGQPLDEFTDVRDLQHQLLEQGVNLETRVETGTSGPGSFSVIDPDGNPVLVDQHI